MKKTILTVFLLLAVLVAIFLVWELFFADTGILHTVYNSVVAGLNAQFQKISGDDTDLIPEWDGGHTANEGHNNTNDDADGGFGIDIERDGA